MLVKLGGEYEASGNQINLSALKANKDTVKITKSTLKEMVLAYRERTKILANPLGYAHFSVEEIITLLIDNGALSSGALGHISSNGINNEGFGLKIYIGNHTNLTNCPQQNANYFEKDTAILCVTIIENIQKFHYRDILKDDSIISISDTRVDDAGSALDQSSTYPPDNPYNPDPIPAPDPCDAFDVGHIC